MHLSFELTYKITNLKTNSRDILKILSIINFYVTERGYFLKYKILKSGFLLLYKFIFRYIHFNATYIGKERKCGIQFYEII